MSWLRDFILLLIGAALLASCGFSPMHGNNPVASELQRIEVAPVAGRNGQIFRIALEDRLHPEGALATPEYRLETQITVTPQAAGIETDREIIRYNLHLLSEFRLLRIADGQEVYSGKIRRISSYNVSDADFSTFVSGRDALERGLGELAEDYRMRLAAFFVRDSSL